jgi:hypothetical protein
MISGHILIAHSEAENQIARQMGGFWAAIRSFFDETRKSPYPYKTYAAQEQG